MKSVSSECIGALTWGDELGKMTVGKKNAKLGVGVWEGG